jgi:hypothetical protein
MALDSNKRQVGDMRDTVKLAVNTSAEVRRKNVQYNNGFILLAGKYHLKFVVRENQTGRMGSFETDIEIPDLKAALLKMSSVVMSGQIQPAKKAGSNNNPLVQNGSEIIPSVTHVFSTSQHLYLYYEIYDPARASAGDVKPKTGEGKGIRVLTNIAFFQGKVKAYEGQLQEVQEINAPDRKAAILQLDVPLAQFKPGFYTCQVNVVDDAAGRFAFPRLAFLVRQ